MKDLEVKTRHCAFPECMRRVKAKNLCIGHYTQHLKGQTLVPLSRTALTVLERFTQKVHRTESCWNWMGSKVPEGYGQMTIRGKRVRAHRWAYEYYVGPIPEDFQLDHTCRNRACVNPYHLRLVTDWQNKQNHGGPKVNSSTGVRGVSFHKASGKYRARANLQGVDYSAGYFDDIHEAEKAVIRLRNSLHTHNLADRTDHTAIRRGRS